MHTHNMRIFSEHERMARIAAFAADSLVSAEQVIGSIGELAMSEIAPVILYQDEADEALATTNPEQAGAIIAVRDDYINYLRMQPPCANPSITGRVALLDAYASFSDSVESFTTSLPAHETRWQKHAAYLGSGANVSTFRYEHGGKKYALRIPRVQDEEAEMLPPAVADNYASGFVYGKGLSGIEQGVAYSLKKGIALSELAPGVVVSKTTAKQLDAMTERHINALFDTYERMSDRDLVTDEGVGNLMFDPEKGFTVIDYAHQPSWVHRDQSTAQKARGLVEELSNRSYAIRPVAADFAWARAANEKLQLLHKVSLERCPERLELFTAISRAMVYNLRWLEGS